MDTDNSAVDDLIKVEYHPSSKRRTTVYPFEQYRDVRPEVDFAAGADEPWRPFTSRADFEFAEIIHLSHMSNDLTTRLLKLIHNVRSGEGDLTFTSQSDVRRAWENASQFYPMVCE